MAKSRPSVQKRKKEARDLEKRQMKAARKAARDAARDDNPDLAPGVDPDLVGIVPGPQDHPWMRDDPELYPEG